MPLPLPFQIEHSETQSNFDQIAQQFPLQFAKYSTITWGGMSGAGSALAAAGNVFIMTGGPTVVAGNAFALVGAANTGAYAFYLDPLDLRTTLYNIRWGCLVNATAPTISVTCGLYPVATFGGAAGSNPTVATVGTVTAGSTVTFTTPGATSNTVTSSSAFSLTAGWYCFAFTASGVGAANSALTLSAHLRAKQV